MFTGIAILLGVIAALISRITGSDAAFYVGLALIVFMVIVRDVSLGGVKK